MIPEHLNELVQCARSHQPQGAVGRRPRKWAMNFISSTTHSSLLENLSKEQESRGSLKSFCSSDMTDIQACFCAIMAWGGMRADHARSAWTQRRQWSPVLKILQEHSREEAYHCLKQCRTSGGLPGIRPAFFTKLLFFLRTPHDAYIMDQWTAKSVNLLFEQDVVALGRDGFVLDNNSPDRYEAFCKCIEEAAEAVSSKLGKTVSGEEMEEIMMSKGGRHPGQWRSHVKTHWIWQ